MLVHRREITYITQLKYMDSKTKEQQASAENNVLKNKNESDKINIMTADFNQAYPS